MRTTQHRERRTRSTLLRSLILGLLIGPWVANNAVAATLPVHCDTGGTVQGRSTPRPTGTRFWWMASVTKTSRSATS